MVVVFDGHPAPVLPGGERDGVDVRWAGGGRGAADAAIVGLVATHPVPPEVVVVTADRELAADVRAAGAAVERPSWLLARLDALDR